MVRHPAIVNGVNPLTEALWAKQNQHEDIPGVHEIIAAHDGPVARDGGYSVSTHGLDAFLIPKKPHDISIESLHQLGRSIGYTKSAFAYLFTRVA
ncbi:hypothetical protein ACWPKO_26760 (plasmid) [Coraliomargarita sp. W4R53]